MKQIRVGIYRLGHEDVELIAAPGEQQGGEFYFIPEDGHIGRIRIYLGYDRWDRVVVSLLHEACEYLLLRLERAFVSTGNVSREVDNRLFVFNHQEFSEVCARAGEFIAAALPDLAKVYRRHRKKG